MLAADMPPMTRPTKSSGRLVAKAVVKKFRHMPAIEYSMTGRRPTLSLKTPSKGMHRNCSRPNTLARMPYHWACSSLVATNSPTRSGKAGTSKPMPSISIKTLTRMNLRLAGRAGGAAAATAETRV